MPLPESPPFRVQAPMGAGIGLRFQLFEDIYMRMAQPNWPPDWWQRNYDTYITDPDEAPLVWDLTERQMHVPGLT
jgi:hypothetical protein